MNKVIIIALMGILLLSFTSCGTEEEENINDALKISTYLFDKSVEESPADWDSNTTLPLEQLKLNEVRIMAPIGGIMNLCNLNLYFEFEGGLIEIISENKDIQLSVGESLEPWISGHDMSKRTYGWSISMANKGFIAALPLWIGYGSSKWKLEQRQPVNGYTGKEYYLTVNAYKLDNDKAPVIKAKLKLVQLEDKKQIEITEKTSRMFSIELVSYEYSDTYKMMEG